MLLSVPLLVKPGMDLGADASSWAEPGDVALGTEFRLQALVHAPELIVEVAFFWLLKLAATK